MAQTHIMSLLALRRLLDHSPLRTFLAQQAITVDHFLRDKGEIVESTLATAVRHAWLGVEIALAGTPVWEQIISSLPHRDGHIFRQQIASLLDLFSLAGLETDNADARRHCRSEL